MKQFMIGILWFGGFISPLLAQNPTNPGKVQVVTKLVEKTFPYQNQTLVIDANKAQVNVGTSADNQIHLKVSLIAKHPSKEKAEKDVQALQIEVSEASSTITAKNTVQPKLVNEKIASLLKTIYEIQVPAQTNLTVKNNYGEVELKQLSGNVIVKANYSDVRAKEMTNNKAEYVTNYSDVVLQGCKGNAKLNLNYGDVKIENCTGLIIEGTSNYGDIKVNGFSGDINLISNYGDIVLEDIADLNKVTIASNYSDILFKNLKNIANYGFEITNNYADVDIAENFKNEFIRSPRLVIKVAKSGAPIVKITANYGDITIK